MSGDSFACWSEFGKASQRDLWLDPVDLNVTVTWPDQPMPIEAIRLGRALNPDAAEFVRRAFDQLTDWDHPLPRADQSGQLWLVEHCTSCGVHRFPPFGNRIPVFHVCWHGGLTVPLCVTRGPLAASLIEHAVRNWATAGNLAGG
jgi:hypothetical protein